MSRRPGEHLWSIRKDGQQLDCELRDHGPWGVEVQICRERGVSLRPALGNLRTGSRGSRRAKGAIREGGLLIA
jgi:hypothetical protein